MEKGKQYLLINDKILDIGSKGGHTPPPFSKISPFLEIQDDPFIGLLGKQKY